MARFGKLPVLVPSGVEVQTTDHSLKVSGPKGTVVRALPRAVDIKIEDGKLVVTVKGAGKQALSDQGTTRSHIINAIAGVTEGWSKTMELVGAGFRAEVRGSDLVLTVGYSHPVIVKAPEGIKFGIEKSLIKVEGADKDLVGLISSRVRGARPPEPYKGKGIKYVDEVIRRKAGKAAAKTTA